MSVLSDRDIRAALESGEVGIRPYDPVDLQPRTLNAPELTDVSDETTRALDAA